MTKFDVLAWAGLTLALVPPMISGPQIVREIRNFLEELKSTLG